MKQQTDKWYPNEVEMKQIMKETLTSDLIKIALTVIIIALGCDFLMGGSILD